MPAFLPPASLDLPPVAAEQRVEIMTFAPGAIVCAGGPVAADRLVSPLPVVITRHGPAMTERASHRLSFAIDAHGRPRTIRPAPAPPVIDDEGHASDLAPSLAATRFAPGAPRADCSVTYVPASTPLAAVPLPVLYELASLPRPRSLPPELWERVRPRGTNCPSEPGQYRRLNLPAVETIAQAPGTTSWVFLAYDVDQAGKPGVVRVLGSSGNAALDRAGAAANRYAPGSGYRGGTYHFHRAGSRDTAMPKLPADTPADPDTLPACAIGPKSIPSRSWG